MKEMKELAAIITNSSQKTFPLLDVKDRQVSKEAALYFAVQRGQCEDDVQASQLIYGKSGDPRYPMLKSRLRRKLYNHLFFLDFNDPHFPPHLIYEKESYDLLHQARMLINSANYDMAESLIKRSLKISIEMGFTSICVACLEISRYLHVVNGRTNAFYKTQEQLVHYRALVECEQEAENIYYTSWLELKKTIDIKKKFLPQLLIELFKLKMLWDKYHLPSVFGFYYKLNIWYHELTGDFAKIIQITLESDQFLQQQIVHPLRFDDRYNKYIQVYAYLRVKEFDQGLQLAEAYLPGFHPSTNNWFAYMENYLLMAVQAQRYDLALRLMKQVDDNPAFRKITKRSKEKWTLYRAYLYFMNPSEALLQQFDFQRFVQAVPEFSKDKQGFNVAILILQFLHFFRTGQIDALLYRIECLRKYALLHLRESANIRSKAFFKLLEIVVKEDFHPARCRQKGNYLSNKLQTTLPPGDAFAEIEIIPYEQLWEWILGNVKRQRSDVKIRA